jgi:DnaJ-class molecular chaperone
MAPGDQAPAGTPGTGEDVCPRCGGSGRLDSKPCTECDGTGKVVKGIGGG